MATLAALQKLSDSDFHRLCDELLPRIENRYRGLTPYGISSQGRSTKGHPDSYVGDTAATCRIAFEYSTQRTQWWNKAVDDVKKARALCDRVQEIVFVTVHDPDRGPRPKGRRDWFNAAEQAASPAAFRFIGGRRIAEELNCNHQDLRCRYLGIPFSRLSPESIIESCQRNNQDTIRRLRDQGRYCPQAYVRCASQHALFQLWQGALPITRGKDHEYRFIALVADAGIGKTSLLCAFSESVQGPAPVLLLQARDIQFVEESSLNRVIVQQLQGTLSPELRLQEEAALARTTEATVGLTVLLDGLDEVGDASAVGRALTHWLDSALGKCSVLIVSSRPEFWRVCHDATWGRYMPRELSSQTTHPRPGRSMEGEAIDPPHGLRLPKPFTDRELSEAWKKAGRAYGELWGMSAPLREELRHPFTLRILADVLNSGDDLARVKSRTDLMQMWLTRRLEYEEDRHQRISQDAYWEALRAIASLSARRAGGWVCVDELGGIPRFDATNPPGPVAERLIRASILETKSGACGADRVRFAFEAVLDFFLGELDVEQMRRKPMALVHDLVSKPFSKVCHRLARVGTHATSLPDRDAFVVELCASDPAMAAIVLRANPSGFASETRRDVTDRVASDLTSRYDARQRFAAWLLGQLDCDESRTSLARALPRVDRCSRRLLEQVALAAIRLSLTPAIEHVYQAWWFGGERFFSDTIALLRHATSGFRGSLGDRALSDLDKQRGTPGYRRAVTALGYLGDERVVPHLGRLLDEGVDPHFYETRALIAIGSASAAQTFEAWILDCHRRLQGARNDENANREVGLGDAFLPYYSGLALFVTEPFEECVLRLMDSPERDVAGIACLLANYFATPPLAQRLVREDMSDCWFLDQVLGGIVGALPVDEWLSLWAHTTSGAIRRNLIFLAGALYDARCEEILLRVLDDTETRLHAVRQLGRMGSRRACPHLLNLLREEQNSVHETILKEVTWVLGDVRYAPAIPDLAAVARWHNSLAAHEALRSLAEMRDDQSEDALLSLAREMPDRCVKALLWHGSPACVQRVLEIARTHPDGPKWLAKQHLGISMIHHWRRGESYNHVHSADLVDYFLANEHMFPGDEKKELQDFFDEVDSPAIRDAFRRWAAQTEGEAGERFWRELALRGDSSALEWYLNREIEGRRRTDPMARDDLSRFPRETLVSALKGHLKSSKDSAARATYLELLGFFGSESDVPFLQGFVDEPDGPVANAAFDATVRLTDPLRLSEDW